MLAASSAAYHVRPIASPSRGSAAAAATLVQHPAAFARASSAVMVAPEVAMPASHAVGGSDSSKKKVFVLGGDGFCGWPTACHLSEKGHEVVIIDNLSRRKIDVELGCSSLTPISSPEVRVATWNELTGNEMRYVYMDLATGARSAHRLRAALARVPAPPLHLLARLARFVAARMHAAALCRGIVRVHAAASSGRRSSLSAVGSGPALPASTSASRVAGHGVARCWLLRRRVHVWRTARAAGSERVVHACACRRVPCARADRFHLALCVSCVRLRV
jgi:hypothetical protein